MKKIRNIAIIAHVDHGKTTLVDQLLKMSGTFRDNEEVTSMDSNAIEQERGITILAKTTAIDYKGYRINILDTPGHADFGGEVERIMNMVDGVLLVVDAYEGTMPQTRFVLKKALEAGVIPIVVVNKIDKPSARPVQVVDEVMDLFIELGADLEQLEFPVIYTSALAGTSSLDPDIATQEKTMDPILDTIIDYIPAPDVDEEGGLQFQPALLDYNDFVGRIGIGRIKRGKVKVNEMVSCVRLDGSIKQFRIQKMFGYLGLKRIEITEASAGDIVAIAGLPDIEVGETVCTIGKEEALPLLRIDEPTLQMTFGVNTSPFVGREGKILTARKIEERLFKETERDVSLKVTPNDSESFIVSGRGELHLSILIENMRREGFELQVSKPEVIVKEIDGVKMEPYEDVQIDVPEEYVGSVIEALGNREGIMENMTNTDNQVRLLYTVPSRGLIGFTTEFMTMTKGYGMLSHTYKEYRVMASHNVGERKQGVLVSMENGKATAYALGQLEDRGVMFIEPGTEVYEGMIVGEHAHDNDLAVNVVKGKKLTNTRASGSDHTVVLKRPRLMTLETCLDYINSDELVEITPAGFRLRKKILDTNLRKKADARK
ncbi:MAG TPA: translational GTPase TypA [Candidatus Fimihabitans intestinipullorum]|mgnify:FL=1|uniref:Large ribosomal subunit assembly factor BipA n=1 Tax=Candidatus Fimihabitans intestinipullorum TaxID=2840820 RepID=A0A9D1HT08_9BACT|nr:translational GTPase TypA [Candidatus Fimihabitans intestinipullorum]